MTPMFKEYHQVEDAMEAVVQRRFIEGPLLRSLQSGAYNLEQVRYFAVQYLYYNRHFPRILGAAISAMEPDSEWWVPLADNLWDEAGRGTPGKAHDRLYLSFLQSVHPQIVFNGRGLPDIPMSEAIRSAVETFIHFFRSATPLEALAAVGLGSEFFAGEVMGAIGRGFRHPRYQSRGPLNLLFWDIHQNRHEPRHYALCRNLLIRYTDHQQHLSCMYETGRLIAESEADMYDTLHQEMLSLS